jgi:hypothetical protein
MGNLIIVTQQFDYGPSDQKVMAEIKIVFKLH